MPSSLLVSVLTTDRPGIVKMLSEIMKQHQASWEDSRMSQLAGHFSGLVMITSPDDKKDQLTADLLQLKDEGYRILVEELQQKPSAEKRTIELELLGQDRPGIVHDITQELTKLGVNIETFDSDLRQASMTCDLLFESKLSLSLPATMSNEEVQHALEAMSDQFMVDITIAD